MSELDILINKYLQFDKKTLAELLAVKELQEKNKLDEYQKSPYPGTAPQCPDYGLPFIIPTFPNNGEWIITCSI